MQDNTNNFDFLRHFLAFCVVWHHFNILTGYSVSFIPLEVINSDVAVKGFFVVSGLLIWLSAFNTGTWKAYVVKRVFRIYPALLFVLLIMSVILISYYAESTVDVLKYFSLNSIFLSFLGNCVGDLFDTNVLCAVNGSLWTLKLEVAYYVFVGLVVYCFKRRAYSLIVGFTVLSFLLESSLLLLPSSMDLLVSTYENQIPFKFYYFGLGVVFYNFHERFSSQSLLLLLIVGFLGWYVFSVKFIFLPLFVLTLVYLLAFRMKAFNFSKYGDLSYGMYIFHFPIIQLLVFEKLFFGVWFIDFILLLVIILLLSKVSWELIESKSILFGKLLSSRM